jgi:hypothetical protein
MGGYWGVPEKVLEKPLRNARMLEKWGNNPRFDPSGDAKTVWRM